MKILSILSLIIAFSLSSFAQPNYTVKTYRVQQGQKVNKYNKAAKDFIKDGRFNEAVMNAAYALKFAEKKNHITSAQGYLNDSYNRAIQENENRIELLEENTESFEGDQTVTDLAEIVRLYKTMRAFNNVLKEVPPKSFNAAKKKEPGFHPDIVDYKNNISVAKEKLAAAKEEAAKMHYAEGRELESEGSKLSSRMAAKKYRWANEYSPGYRDAKMRYEEVRKLGTTRMGLMKFESGGSQYGDLGAIVSDKLLDYLATKASDLEFFEVIDRNQLDVVVREQQLALSGLMDESTTADIGELHGVDVILVGSVNKNFIDRQKSGPTDRAYSKEVTIRTEKYIDDKGKEKTRKIKGTVYAQAKVYEKKADAYVGCSYKVLDVKTGAVLYSGNSTGTDDWNKKWIGSYTGDKRALPSLMKKSEPDYPSYDRMINVSSNKAANQIYTELLSYALKVGK